MGNPGAEYAGTRHNIGADAAEILVARHRGTLSAERSLRASVATLLIGDQRVLVAVPTTYMNDSGLAAAALVRRSGILEHGDAPGGQPGGMDRLIVLHDELDLPPGRVKIKVGGGTAGNNGLKSIHAHLHSSEYTRVRIGIGKPPGRQSGASFVLRRPGTAERAELDVAAERAADAVELLVVEGVEMAMNRINTAP